MNIKIQEAGTEILSQYARIPIAFKVESILKINQIDNGIDTIKLNEEKVNILYIKDYDTYDGGPEKWAERFDIRNWGFFLAMDGNRYVGGAAVALKTPELRMLENRSDIALLWDLRIHPDFRRFGIGTKLFDYSVNWARKQGCKHLKIETQNVNVPACKLYIKQDCKLIEVNRYAYAGHPEIEKEVMLIWYLSL